MARPLRIEFVGALYHVTGRGNAREDIYCDDVDRQQFLMLLRNTVNRYDWYCHRITGSGLTFDINVMLP